MSAQATVIASSSARPGVGCGVGDAAQLGGGMLVRDGILRRSSSARRARLRVIVTAHAEPVGSGQGIRYANPWTTAASLTCARLRLQKRRSAA
jgi:hypothetical protein